MSLAKHVRRAALNRDSHRLQLRVRDLEQQCRRLKYEVSELRDQALEYERQLSFVAEFENCRPPEAWPKSPDGRSGEYCAIVAASDWHLGERVSSSAVCQLNRFNASVAERRVRRLFEKIPEYCERYAPKSKLLVFWLGGDLISGHIHEDLVQNNSMSPTEECLWARDLICDGLATLLRDLAGWTVLIPTSAGNHGRTTAKRRVATALSNSYEQMLYRMLSREWRKEKRIHWQIGSGYLNVVKVCGRKVRFHHGDAINYHGGVGGITIPVNKAIAQWNKLERCDLDVFGHFHQWMDGNNFVSNGSLVGYGEYSLSIKAEYQPPIQGFLVFDRKYGLRQSTRIILD